MALKSAEDWNQDYGLHNCEQVIMRIQVDALRHAMDIAHEYCLPHNIRAVLKDEIERLDAHIKAGV